jgi:chromate transporter
MSILLLLLIVLAGSALAFGNGPAMLPLLRRWLVGERGPLTEEQLMYAFALSQVTPGQGNLYVASVGFMLSGTAVALLAVLVINLPGVLVLPLARCYERTRHLAVVRRAVRGLTSASTGLIFATCAEMGRDALAEPTGWVVFFTVLAMTLSLRWGSLSSLLIGSCAGLLFRVCV